jgi:hypothetical protein
MNRIGALETDHRRIVSPGLDAAYVEHILEHLEEYQNLILFGDAVRQALE